MISRLNFLIMLLVCVVNVYCKIIIYQCCPRGESLSPNKQCEKYNHNWTPAVYSQSRSSLLPPGTIPPEFEFIYKVPDCATATHFEDAKNQVLTEDYGSLFIDETVLQPGTFCTSPTGVIGCLTEEHLAQKKKKEKRVRKCCPTGAMYSEKQSSCIQTNIQNKTNFLSEDTYIHSGFPHCEIKEYTIAGKLDVEYSLNVDGTLSTKTGPSVTNYCVEYIVEQPNEKASIFTCANALPNSKPDGDDIRYTIYPLGFFLSIFFLAITLISSFMLPSSYHALHWKCQTHYVACLLVGDLLLATTQLASDSMKHSFTCVGIAISMHFFFLAAFFWLNTMCFNIWWTFRDLRPTTLDKGQETYRLVLYELYAWGGPLLIVSVGTILDQLKEKYPFVLRPNFGQNSCWFRGTTEQFVYFFGPIGVLLMVNLILFAATTRELTCGLWKREVVKSTTERTALSHICLKLVIVMGITWIVDVLSWVVGGPQYLWYIPDLVNALQGVLIFIVVGCQPQVWSTIKRIWCLKDSPSRNGGRSYSSNATPSIINDHSTTKPVETLC